MTRKRKRAPPLESEVHGEDMDVDVHTTLSPSITAPPLFSAQLSPVVPPIGNSHALEENGDADIIPAVSKGKKKDAKSSSRAKGKKKGRKQPHEVELDDLMHKSTTDEPVAVSNALEDDDLVGEEAPKVTSKKKTLPKSIPAAKSKSKPKGKGKGKAVLSESEHEDDDDPRSRSPNQGNHSPEDEDSRGDSSKKDSEIIAALETTKVLHFDTL
jgi:hypothetical protein